MLDGAKRSSVHARVVCLEQYHRYLLKVCAIMLEHFFFLVVLCPLCKSTWRVRIKSHTSLETLACGKIICDQVTEDQFDPTNQLPTALVQWQEESGSSPVPFFYGSTRTKYHNAGTKVNLFRNEARTSFISQYVHQPSNATHPMVKVYDDSSDEGCVKSVILSFVLLFHRHLGSFFWLSRSGLCV